MRKVICLSSLSINSQVHPLPLLPAPFFQAVLSFPFQRQEAKTERGAVNRGLNVLFSGNLYRFFWVNELCKTDLLASGKKKKT